MEKLAIQIVEKLQKAGFEAYFAGGCVRDLLMGKTPQDYDIATNAKPEELEKLMPKTIPIGKQFGVMLVVVEGHHFEIATFRSDSSYSDGRRPDAVLFTSAKEDAVRRDFTINGLFYDPLKNKVLDFVGGQEDIQKKILRFIGTPHERVKEDHLRLLRAVRFKNNFDLKYEAKTKAAIKELAHLIQDVSAERVQDEITKMLLHPHRSHSIKELDEFGMLERLIPEVAATKGIKQPYQYHLEGDVFTHLLKGLHEMPANWVSKELVWAVFLHDVGKPETFEMKKDRIHFNHHAEIGAKLAAKLCKRLKFPNAETSKIVWLIEHHMSIGHIPHMRRAHQVNYFLHPWFEDLMRLSYCDEYGSHPPDVRLHDEVMKLYRDFKDEKLLEDHFRPKYTGDELMKEFKLKPGPALKEILMSLREAKIEGQVKTKADERKLVKKIVDLMSADDKL